MQEQQAGVWTSHHSHKDNSPIWRETENPLFQQCGRAGCRVMRQRVKGVWIESQPAKKKPAQDVTQQPGLWG